MARTAQIKRGIYRLGGISAVALIALVPVFAVKAARVAPQAAPVQTASTQTTPTQITPPLANSGATSTGGSFFTPPAVAKGQQRQAATGNAMAATEVPEPAMIGLFGAGLAGLAFARFRARRKPDNTALSDR